MAENVVITKQARMKIVKARAGAITLPKVVGLAFGDGGVNSKGDVISPVDTQTNLNHELLRKKVDSYTFKNETTCSYICTLGVLELVGKSISEVGLYDEDGDLLCIKNFTKKGKDKDMEMIFTLDDVF